MAGNDMWNYVMSIRFDLIDYTYISDSVSRPHNTKICNKLKKLGKYKQEENEW